MARSAARRNEAQFTYDFGIAVAQSTVNKITRLTGVTLTLASAYYALKNTSAQYVNTLRENTLRLGGVLSTMKAIEQAQNRLIKGQSYFSVDDQLAGMNRLMSVGIDVGKNLEWINKAAHATGKSYAEFSGMIASAIQGNAQALVDAGLMTQRATRMFDKYAANTVMRQQAILNFIKNHKGLMNAIKNDFETIQDQTTRLKGIWQAFLQSIVGKPNDPQSFYGQVVASMKMVAEALAKNMESIKRYGYVIGQTLGWVIRQVGHFVVWVGRESKIALESAWRLTDDYQNQTRSLLVWLEFWKLKVVDFFDEYGGAIKTILKLLIAFKALKTVFVISDLAYMSLIRYKRAMRGLLLLQQKYLVFMGPVIGNKFSRWLQSLAVFMPRWLRRVWVSVGKFFERGIFGGQFKKFIKSGFGFTTAIPKVKKFFRMLNGFAKNATKILSAINPFGGKGFGKFKAKGGHWIVTIILLLLDFYKKSESFRRLMNNLIKGIKEGLKLIWNSIMGIITYVMIGIKRVSKWFNDKIWIPVSSFFTEIGNWISGMWNKFMDSRVAKWIKTNIVNPLKNLFQWLIDAWNWVVEKIAGAVSAVAGRNSELAKSIRELAKKEGVPELPVFEGGNYDTNDATDYLSFNKGKTDTKDKPVSSATLISAAAAAVTPKNPLITSDSSGGTSALPSDSDFGLGGDTNLNFSNGAIQIIVQKGTNIDENVLAKKVRQVILDMQREGSMRGGTV